MHVLNINIQHDYHNSDVSLRSDFDCQVKINTLQWRHNERVSVSNHKPHDSLLNRLFKARMKENIKAPRHWPLCGEFTVDRWIPRTKGQ